MGENQLHPQESRLAIFRDMKDCAVKYGAGYMDYDLFEMYNLTPEQRDTYLTRGRNNALVVKYNDKAYTGQFDDKVQFNTLFGKYLHRDWVPVTGDNRDQVMAFLAAQVIPQVGYVGWDVCFTPNGPCLVEGNPFPGHDIYQLPVHTPDKIGIMPRFREIEAEEKMMNEE